MTYSGNYYLSLDEMTVNAQYILDYLSPLGWTKNSVCGMLGNLQIESTINPGIWQSLNEGNMNGGFGLVQWTPATKYTDWADANNLVWGEMDSNLKRILYELDNNLQWIETSEYPISFHEFTVSTESPEYLASVFLKNYERAGVEVEDERRANARYWYDTLNGSGGNVLQLAVLPIHHINVTQGEDGDFSHGGSLALDMVGTTNKYPYYAPFDCKCVYVQEDNSGAVVWESQREVKCVDGTVSFVSFIVCHDDEWSNNVVGTLKKKGDLIGHTGTYGGTSTGDHLHIEASKEKFTGVAWVENPEGNNSYPNPSSIYNIFSSCDNVTDEVFEIVNGYSYPWKCMIDWDDGSSDLPNNNINDFIVLNMCGVLNIF